MKLLSYEAVDVSLQQFCTACNQDTPLGQMSTQAAAAATTSVCPKIRSGRLISLEFMLTLLKDISPEWNTKFSIRASITTTCSLKVTTAEIHLRNDRRRVQFATRQVGQQSLWFQHEHNVRTAEALSTWDTWARKHVTPTENEAATLAGTTHRKSQLT